MLQATATEAAKVEKQSSHSEVIVRDSVSSVATNHSCDLRPLSLPLSAMAFRRVARAFNPLRQAFSPQRIAKPKRWKATEAESGKVAEEEAAIKVHSRSLPRGFNHARACWTDSLVIHRMAHNRNHKLQLQLKSQLKWKQKSSRAFIQAFSGCPTWYVSCCSNPANYTVAQ
jgi:hypothetical protein